MDLAGYEGALTSPAFEQIGARIFLHKSPVHYKTRPPRYADERIFFDASQFYNWEQARQYAFDARGSFEGLYDNGIALHSRNAYQILLDDLQTPVSSVVYWARPVGKKGQVKGGTNTAVQLARRFNVPQINIYTDEGMEKVLNYIKRSREIHV
ncbi:DprA-like DNA recombination-mediator protein [Xanthomonas phage RTH11]|nr:DprA-like DNA recombination-mediator protein [Xanthomonas phage RTH11]